MSESLAAGAPGRVAGYLLCMTAGLLLSLMLIAGGVAILAHRLVQPWDAELVALSETGSRIEASVTPQPGRVDGR